MRKLVLTVGVVGFLAGAVSAQYRRPANVPRPPQIPLAQPGVPQLNPNSAAAPVTNPAQLNSTLTNVPSASVYIPPRPYGYGNTYYVNNPYPPFGYPSGGFTGMAAPSGQFYAVLGGPAPSNPFVSNFPNSPTWGNMTGMAPNGQPWAYPFNVYNFNNLPQYPIMMNAPVVGQSNGWLPNPAPAVNPNNFGVQAIPGINGLR